MYEVEKSVLMDAMLKAQLKEGPHFGCNHLMQYTPKFVFDMINQMKEQQSELVIQGHKVHVYAKRYVLFEQVGRVCVTCGVEGTVMCLDTNLPRRYPRNSTNPAQPQRPKSKKATFNLYGIAESGRVALLTKDHIIPKSKGGPDEMSNFQVMCNRCNAKKADK